MVTTNLDSWAQYFDILFKKSIASVFRYLFLFRNTWAKNLFSRLKNGAGE